MNELGTFLTSVLGVSCALGDGLTARRVGVVAVVLRLFRAYLAIRTVEARIATARDVQRAFAQTMGSYTKSDLACCEDICARTLIRDPNGDESHRQVVICS